jgi:hypothetical protein
MIHRPETGNFLGVPVSSYLNIEDSEEEPVCIRRIFSYGVKSLILQLTLIRQNILSSERSSSRTSLSPCGRELE